MHAGDLLVRNTQFRECGDVRPGMPRIAHDPYPPRLAGQPVAQHDADLRPVVVGHDQIGGLVKVLSGIGRDQDARRDGCGMSTVGIGLGEHGAVARVPGEVQQVSGHRRREDGDERTVSIGIGAMAVRDITCRVLVRLSHTDELATGNDALATLAGGHTVRAGDRAGAGMPGIAPGGGKGQVGMKLSARNQIDATVTAITLGEAIANVDMDAGGVRLVASITVEAARELGLAEGARVLAVVKASDVIVAIPD